MLYFILEIWGMHFVDRFRSKSIRVWEYRRSQQSQPKFLIPPGQEFSLCQHRLPNQSEANGNESPHVHRYLSGTRKSADLTARSRRQWRMHEASPLSRENILHATRVTIVFTVSQTTHSARQEPRP